MERIDAPSPRPAASLNSQDERQDIATPVPPAESARSMTVCRAWVRLLHGHRTHAARSATPSPPPAKQRGVNLRHAVQLKVIAAAPATGAGAYAGGVAGTSVLFFAVSYVVFVVVDVAEVAARADAALEPPVERQQVWPHSRFWRRSSLSGLMFRWGFMQPISSANPVPEVPLLLPPLLLFANSFTVPRDAAVRHRRVVVGRERLPEVALREVMVVVVVVVAVGTATTAHAGAVKDAALLSKVTIFTAPPRCCAAVRETHL